MDSNKIINEIEKTRISNNRLWMKVLRTAFQFAPAITKEIFKSITKNDKEINKLSKKLCEDVDDE